MLTWKLWRALSQPHHLHPLFQHVYSRQRYAGRLQRLLFLSSGYFLACVGITLCWPVLTLNPGTVLIVALVGSHTVFGTLWSDRVSAVIAREYDLKTFDLLSMLPSGAFGAGWTLAMGSLYASPFFRYTSLMIRILGTIVLTMLILTLVIPAMLSVAQWGSQDTGLLFNALWNLCLAFAGFYFDYVQSVVLAQLVGILASTYSLGHLNTRLMANGGFMLLKIMNYLFTFMTGFIFLNSFYEVLDLPLITAIISLPVLRLLLFYGCHEISIQAIWIILHKRLHSTPYEIIEAI